MSSESYTMSLSTLLEQHFFKIPKFQRPYAWDENQIADYTDDISNLASGKESDEHYFGTVISYTEPRHNYERPYTCLIDGQQRITTYLLGCSAVRMATQHLIKCLSDKVPDEKVIRGYCQSIEAEVIKSILFSDMENSTGKMTDRHRMEVVGPANVVPRASLDYQTSTLTPDQKKNFRYVANRDLISKKLFEKIIVIKKSSLTAEKNEAYVWLSRVVAAMRTKSRILHFQAKSRDSAYKMFSILNDRGRPLSDADLLKTRCLELTESNPAAHEATELAWSKITENSPSVGRKKTDPLSQYLRHYYSVRSGKRWPSQRLIAALTNEFLTDQKSGKDTNRAALVQEFCQGLWQDFKPWLNISKGFWPTENPEPWFADRLKRIVVDLRNEQAIPLLLAAYRLPEKDFRFVVLRTELFLFRAIVCKAHKSKLGDILFALARNIRSSTPFSRTKFDKAIHEALVSFGLDTTFEARLREIQYGKKNKVIAHFFSTIYQYKHETARTEGELPSFEHSTVFVTDNVHIEHIYPANPDHSTLDVNLEALKNSIGNLTILDPTDNRIASNKGWPEKRPTFQTSLIAENRSIASSNQSWNQEAVLKRSDDLVSRALKLWQSPGGSIDSGGKTSNEIAFGLLIGDDDPNKATIGISAMISDSEKDVGFLGEGVLLLKYVVVDSQPVVLGIGCVSGVENEEGSGLRTISISDWATALADVPYDVAKLFLRKPGKKARLSKLKPAEVADIYRRFQESASSGETDDDAADSDESVQP